MESKKQILDFISKEGHERRQYLTDLLKYMPEAIAKELAFVEVKKNENIIVAGSKCDTVYFLVKGEVTGIEHHERGRIYSFLDFTEVFILGDFELFAGESEYSATIRAQKDCKVLKLSANSYLRWIQHDENALYLRLNNILQCLMFERKHERGNLFMGSKERLADFILKLYEKGFKSHSGQCKVELTQAELADKIGCNIRSVQRSIAALEKESLISNSGGKITVSYEQYQMLQQFNDDKERSE